MKVDKNGYSHLTGRMGMCTDTSLFNKTTRNGRNVHVQLLSSLRCSVQGMC